MHKYQWDDSDRTSGEGLGMGVGLLDLWLQLSWTHADWLTGKGNWVSWFPGNWVELHGSEVDIFGWTRKKARIRTEQLTLWSDFLSLFFNTLAFIFRLSNLSQISKHILIFDFMKLLGGKFESFDLLIVDPVNNTPHQKDTTLVGSFYHNQVPLTFSHSHSTGVGQQGPSMIHFSSKGSC